jgi:hypothetical protein
MQQNNDVALIKCSAPLVPGPMRTVGSHAGRCARWGTVISSDDNEAEALAVIDGGGEVVKAVCGNCVTPEERQAIDEEDMIEMERLRRHRR